MVSPPTPANRMAFDVIVVGGGVIGLTSAWHLADAGLTVVVVDPEPGRGASWAAAGMLAPTTELTYTETDLLGENLRAHAAWADHAAQLGELGHDVGYVHCGSLMVARDADDAAELTRLMEAMTAQGLEVRWLRGREARALEPALDPRVRGAIRVDSDDQVDPRALVRSLTSIAQTHPRISLRRARVRAVRVDGATSHGVQLDDGTHLDTGTVVLAAGAHSGLIAGVPPTVAEGIRPVKGQILHLRGLGGEPPLLARTIRGLRCYIVTRPDGRILVGATVEEQGFDTQVTAGGVHGLLRAAWELVPGITECAFDGATAGLRPGTPDNQPLIGRPDDAPGLVLATGHFRHGVLHSPLTARRVVAAVTGDAAPIGSAA